MRKFLIVSTALLLASPVMAQSVRDLGEKSSLNAAFGVSPSTPDFLVEAAVVEMFELEASKLADQRGDAPTKTFARKMIADHTNTINELKSLAKGDIPNHLDTVHQKRLDKLSKSKGKDFAKAYRQDQLMAHREAVSLYRRYAEGGQDEQLKSYSNQKLQSTQTHATLAENLTQ